MVESVDWRVESVECRVFNSGVLFIGNGYNLLL